VPAVPPDEAAAIASKAVAGGYGTVKVKVGDGDDVSRVAAVRDAAGPHVAVRVDANGAWDVDTAVSFVSRLASFDLEFVEQPVESIDDLAAVRRRVSVRVAADECVRSTDDASHVAEVEAADVLVVKVQPLGGVAAAMHVAGVAGLPVVVSSMFETSVGLAAGLALAAALPDPPLACGLATLDVLAGDVVADSLAPVNGHLAVRRPVPDPDLVSLYAERS
jgi:O-succinylbenzoate synthase